MNNKFFDGKSSKPKIISIKIKKESEGTIERLDEYENVVLEITDINSHNVYDFDFSELTVIENPIYKRPGIIGKKDSKIRLYISDHDLFYEITSLIPKKNYLIGHSFDTQRIIRITYLGLIASTFIFVFFISSPDYIIKMVPHELEESIAKSTIEQIQGSSKICNNELGIKEFKELYRPLVSNAEKMMSEKDIPVKIYIFENSVPNALTTTDGNIVIFSGLIDYSDSPDEILGVIAHELSHAIAKHPIKGLVRQTSLNILMVSLFGFTLDSSILSTVINMQYSQEYEYYADELGSKLLNDAGYSNEGLSVFLSKIMQDEQEETFIDGYFSSHPATIKRIENLKKLNNINAKIKISEENWQHIKQICN